MTRSRTRHHAGSFTPGVRAIALVLLLPSTAAALGTHAATSAGIAAAQPAAAERAAHPLGFMTGSYSGTLGDGSMPCEEFWTPLAGGHMLGAFRLFDAEGELVVTEHMTLSVDGDGTAEDSVTYRLRHFTPDLQPWASELDGPIVAVGRVESPGRLVLEPRENAGNLARIIYAAGDGRSLVATLEHADGTPPLVLPMSPM